MTSVVIVYGAISVNETMCDYIHYKVWDELLVQSQASTVQPMEYGSG